MQAATQLASGLMITVTSVADEITIFLLMKEFGGTPSQWRSQSTRDIKFITTVLSTYNKIKNAEIERQSRQAGKGSKVGKVRSTGKFRREERVGPNGIEIVDILI